MRAIRPHLLSVVFAAFFLLIDPPLSAQQATAEIRQKDQLLPISKNASTGTVTCGR